MNRRGAGGRVQETIELTALVVTRDRDAELAACVESLLRDPRTDVEVLVVENGATDAVRGVLDGLRARDARLRTIRIEATSPSLARNRGAEDARGALVFFLDDDVIVPERAVGAAIELMRARPDVGIAGGPNLTPGDDPELAKISGAILASRFGTGIAVPRYAARAAGPARESDLVLCNLVVRRSLFRDGLSFPQLFGGEENHLMGHAESRGVAMWYEPSLAVHHRRRRTLAGHVEQVHRYGIGRANAIVSAPRTFRLAYLVPLGFVAYLASLPLTAWIGPVHLLPLAAYVVADAIASTIAASAMGRPSYLPAVFALFPITHVSYGLGLGRGLLRHAFARRSPVGSRGAR